MSAWLRRAAGSLVARLMVAFILGGVILSLALAVVEVHQSERSLRRDLAGHAEQTARSIRDLWSASVGVADPERTRGLLSTFLDHGHVRGLRLQAGNDAAVTVGRWPAGDGQATEAWDLRGPPADASWLALDRPTLARMTFPRGADTVTLELLIDGPAAAQGQWRWATAKLGQQWLLLGVLTLLGLLLLRRWFTAPLSQVVELVDAGAGPEPFDELGRQHDHELGRLCQAIGRMLTGLDGASRLLRLREQAFKHLYEFAPVALLGLDRAGRVMEANRRAASLLGLAAPEELTGRDLRDFLPAPDRPLLGQAIERLETESSTRWHMQVRQGDQVLEAAAECVGVCDAQGQLQGARLSLLDITQARQLQRQLEEKSQLLNLVIDHMSDAILLVDAAGRIAAFNQQLLALLRARAQEIAGQVYDPQVFWGELGVLDHDLFLGRLRQIEAQQDRPTQERVETRAGTFLFQGIPVHDTGGRLVGRLWVVQEITPQEQSQRLLRQQNQQIQALRHMGQTLADVRGLEELLERVAGFLREAFGVEAVGLALRCDEGGRRARQLIHRGPGGCLLEPHRALVQAVEKHLMPQALAQPQALFWPELSPSLPWAGAFMEAGLTCAAACSLRGNADAQGLIWIARRGGERLERHHLNLLEALAPVVAARLELAQLRDRMHDLRLTDAVTDLPNERQFQAALAQLERRPGHPWSLVVLDLDHFRRLNERVDHQAADRLLREVALHLRRLVRRSCLVARLEGARFGVTCPNVPLQQAAVMAQRLLEAIRLLRLALPDGHIWQLTASIGVAGSPEAGQTAEDVLARAQARTGLARRTGRDRVVIDDAQPDCRAG